MNDKNDEKDALIKDLCACEQKYLARIAEQDARIAELTAEVARLCGLVEDAYKEGADDGYNEAQSDERGNGDIKADWETSTVRNVLRETK